MTEIGHCCWYPSNTSPQISGFFASFFKKGAAIESAIRDLQGVSCY